MDVGAPPSVDAVPVAISAQSALVKPLKKVLCNGAKIDPTDCIPCTPPPTVDISSAFRNGHVAFKEHADSVEFLTTWQHGSTFVSMCTPVKPQPPFRLTARALSRDVAIGGFLLIRDVRGRVLLIQKKDGQWYPPGGLVHCGEKLKDAAIRECAEETGFVLPKDDIAHVMLCYESVMCDASDLVTHHNIMIVYYAMLRTEGPDVRAADPDEVVAAKWIFPEDTAAYSPLRPSTALFLEKLFVETAAKSIDYMLVHIIGNFSCHHHLAMQVHQLVEQARERGIPEMDLLQLVPSFNLSDPDLSGAALDKFAELLAKLLAQPGKQ